MLGIAWLSFNMLLAAAGIIYVLDYFGMLRKIPLLNLMSGRVPKNGLILLGSFVLIGVGFGWISIGGLMDDSDGTGYTGPSNAQTAQTYSGDIKLMMSTGDGSNFADGDYNFYLLDYTEYADKSKYEIMQTVVDSGVSALKAPGGGTPSASSTTDGAIERVDMNAQIGQRFVLFGYNSESPSAGDHEVIKESFTIKNYNENLGTFTVSPNRFQLYKYGAVDTYNFAESDISGYVESESSSVEKTISFDMYPQSNYRIGDDMGMYVELPDELQGDIDSIAVTTEDGTKEEFTNYKDISNMDTSDPVYESAPDKQNSDNAMYYVGELPDIKRTSDTNKDPINVKVTYTHPGSGTNNAYFYGVQLLTGGQDLHFDIAQNPAFNLNATTAGSDGWTT